MREGKVASIWIQILATFPSRIYRREVKSTLSQKPFGRPWVRLATCIVCFAWFRSDHVQRVHRVQHEVCSVCWSALLAFTSPFGLFAHTPWLPGTRLSGSNPRPFMVFERACFYHSAINARGKSCEHLDPDVRNFSLAHLSPSGKSTLSQIP